MMDAGICIYLLNKVAGGCHDLAHHLQGMSVLQLHSASDIRSLSAPPSPAMIIVLNWHQHDPEERRILLQASAANPAITLIITAAHFSCDDARSLIGGGQCELINAPAPITSIAEAVRRAADRARLAQQQMAEYAAATEVIDRLTPREKDILAALSFGVSNKVAARQLQLSPRTVEVHRANMVRRSGVAHLGQLIQLHLTMERHRVAAPLHPGNGAGAVQPCDMAHPATRPAYPVTSPRCSARPIESRIGSDF